MDTTPTSSVPSSTVDSTQVESTTATIKYDEANANVPGQQAEKEKVVIIDGPLGHIYTQALNMVYAHDKVATEGIAMMFDALVIKQGPDSSEVKEEDDAAYLYCIGDGYLTGGGLLDAAETIRVATESKKYKKMIVSIESGDVIQARTQLLGELCEAMGVQVCLTRNKAVRTVLNNL